MFNHTHQTAPTHYVTDVLGGVAALLYVTFRKVNDQRIPLSTVAEVTSYYWHFMDGLWVFLLALLYLGK